MRPWSAMSRVAEVLRSSYRSQVLLGLALSGGLSGAWVQALADPGIDAGAAAQLARMASAADNLDYQGTLVYLADNRLETLHIVHRVSGGEVAERLVSLSGPVRALARRRDEVTCALSDDRSISVKRQAALPTLLKSTTIDPAVLSANYFVHPLGETRVAGRDTDVVGVVPRDDYRYGYRFYLDRKTGLSLKSDLMGNGGIPVEQVMFATVQFGATEVAPEGLADPVVSRPTDSPAYVLDQASDPAATDFSPWRFETLPPGFALRMRDTLPGGPDGTGGQVEHFLVTDHLASMSVFVEDAAQSGLDGPTRIGAVHAIGGRIAGYQVTVVGQVPAETVAAVLAGLRHTAGGQQ